MGLLSASRRGPVDSSAGGRSGTDSDATSAAFTHYACSRPFYASRPSDASTGNPTCGDWTLPYLAFPRHRPGEKGEIATFSGRVRGNAARMAATSRVGQIADQVDIPPKLGSWLARLLLMRCARCTGAWLMGMHASWLPRAMMRWANTRTWTRSCRTLVLLGLVHGESNLE